MGFVPIDRLEGDADARAVRRDARAAIRALQAILESPAFTHNVDLAVLTKIAADETMRPRERRRAAEVLCAFRLRTLTTLAGLLGAREQSLAATGLDDASRGRSIPSVVVQISTPKPADVSALRAAQHRAIESVVGCPPSPADVASSAKPASGDRTS